MAAIEETLILQDRFSATFSHFLQMGTQAAQTSVQTAQAVSGIGTAAVQAAAQSVTIGKGMASGAELAAQAAKNYQSQLNRIDRQLISLNAQFEAALQEQQAMANAGKQNTAAFAQLDRSIESTGQKIRSLTTQYAMLAPQAQEAAQAARRFVQAQEMAAEQARQAKIVAAEQARQAKIVAAEQARQAAEQAQQVQRAAAAQAQQMELTAQFTQTQAMANQMIAATSGTFYATGNATAYYAQQLNAIGQQLAQTNVEMRIQQQILSNVAAAEGNTSAEAVRLTQELSATTARAQSLTRQQATLRSMLEQAAGSTRNAERALRQYSAQTNAAGNATNAFMGRLRGLVGAYAGLRGLGSLLNLSDEMVATTARINRMNDGLQTTDELNKMIFQSALRSRGAYAETADFVSKLGTQAGSAFGSSAEIVAFAEQINKQLALSGVSAQAASGALLQLTQGLSSGVLRGEELNSVLEQTPMIAQNIAKYMGVTTGEMRELASKGAVTAQVVKNAMFSAAQETNELFENIPMTWGQMWTRMQNIAIRASTPILNGVNKIINGIDDGIEWVADHLDTVIPVVAAVSSAFVLLGASAAAAKIPMVAAAIEGAAAWAVANWPILAVAASIGLVIYQARQMGATWEEIGTVVGGVFAGMYAAAMNSFIVPSQNGFANLANFMGNVFKNPTAAIVGLFYDTMLTVLGYIRTMAHAIEDLLNKIPGFEINVASYLDSVYEWAQGAAEEAKKNSGWTEYVKPWEFLDYSETMSKGANIGKRAGAWLDNLNMDDLKEQLFGSGSMNFGGDTTSAYLQQIANNTSGIKKAVSAADEDIRSLVDVAERRYINNINLTNQTPVITINGANTGNTSADRKVLADTIARILLEESASNGSRSTARPQFG